MAFGPFLVVAVLLSVVYVSHAQSLHIVVNTVADSVDANPGDCICEDANGLCSLRAALQTLGDGLACTGAATAFQITLYPGYYRPASAYPAVAIANPMSHSSRSFEIVGMDKEKVAFSLDQYTTFASPLFDFEGGVANNNMDITMKRMTFKSLGGPPMTSAILSGTIEMDQQFALSEIVVDAQAEVPGGPFLRTISRQTVTVGDSELHHPNPFSFDVNIKGIAFADSSFYGGQVIDLQGADSLIHRCYFSETGVCACKRNANTLRINTDCCLVDMDTVIRFDRCH